MNAAIVIGVDEYGAGAARLSGAVSDAEKFFDWVTDPRRGNVRPEHARLLLARANGEAPPPDPNKPKELFASKDNIVTAINDLVTASEHLSDETFERLYFYFSGHGIAAWVSNREESALVTPGFDRVHPDHSLAIRSLAEFFETTLFRDQFFFIDACRSVPWPGRDYEIGRWPIPRRRNPGALPAQQYVLYAVPGGVPAEERIEWWPGEAVGAFSDALMDGLQGDAKAKVWSWERSRYEVRWEGLAEYVRDRMTKRKDRAEVRGKTRPSEGWPIRIPQDTGSRGVADRDRDAILVSFPRNRRFKKVTLTVALVGAGKREVDVSVLDAIGQTVASALKVTGGSHGFSLPPRTYAVQAETKGRRGRVKYPVDLYADEDETIRLDERITTEGQAVDKAFSDEAERPGVIIVHPPDPLTVTELRDESGRVPELEDGAVRTGRAKFKKLPAGFYRVRFVGPDTEAASDDLFVVLRPGETERVPASRVKPPKSSRRAIDLARVAGGEYLSGDRSLVLSRRIEPLQWAQASTILAVALGDALESKRASLLTGLAVDPPAATLDEDAPAGVALYAVAGRGRVSLRGLAARVWPSGEAVGSKPTRFGRSAKHVAAYVTPVGEPGSHWLSIERGGEATVIALPVLRGRLATVIAQVDEDRLRLYQFHPSLDGGPSATAGRLRRVEHLQRLILGGRLDGARQLAEELAGTAADDPFAACLAGYALLRFGLDARASTLLAETVDAVTSAAPNLSDAYILRAQHQMAGGDPEMAAQAFSDAVNVGIPAFGEGLTRLLEGMRSTNLVHPRGALVRHIFQRHARGSMWSAFTPVKKLEVGRLVISGADLGFEG